MNLKSFSDHIHDIYNLNDISLYGIRIGTEMINKTIKFVENLTLEPPYSFYSH